MHGSKNTGSIGNKSKRAYGVFNPPMQNRNESLKRKVVNPCHALSTPALRIILHLLIVSRVSPSSEARSTSPQP
jgi:hypothetical protein